MNKQWTSQRGSNRSVLAPYLNAKTVTLGWDFALGLVRDTTDPEVDLAFRNAAYGILWVVQTGRCSGQVESAIKAMTARQLNDLVLKVAISCQTIADMPAYIIALLTPKAA